VQGDIREKPAEGRGRVRINGESGDAGGERSQIRIHLTATTVASRFVPLAGRVN